MRGEPLIHADVPITRQIRFLKSMYYLALGALWYEKWYTEDEGGKFVEGGSPKQCQQNAIGREGREPLLHDDMPVPRQIHLLKRLHVTASIEAFD